VHSLISCKPSKCNSLTERRSQWIVISSQKPKGGDFVGQLTLEEITKRLHAGQILGSYAATKSFGPSYSQLIKLGSPIWVTVADLIANPQIVEVTPDLMKPYITEEGRQRTHQQSRIPLVMGGTIGIFIGGVIGFLTRPSAPLIGQLDFQTVISRGSNLKGLDRVLVPIAETSFNYLIIGVIIGGLIGFGVSDLISVNRQSNQRATPSHRTASTTAATSVDGIAENIKRLSDLKNSGILTEEEFQAKKAELLKRI
jgi:hypothetical protein